MELVVENITSFKYATTQLTFATSWTFSNNIKRSANVGYAFGSPLLVVNANNTMRSSPLLVSFSDSAGNCTVDSTVYETPMELRFGHDSVHTCIGGSSYFITNLLNTVKWISKLGYALSSDSSSFASVNSAPNTNDGVSILQIGYSRIGR